MKALEALESCITSINRIDTNSSIPEMVTKDLKEIKQTLTKVKRYFEISSGNIGDNLDEFMRLEKEIKEMVGIK
jgi:hypothetical protein